MGVDFSTIVYLPCQDFFARDITITPIMSNPSASAYTLRGIWDTGDVEILPDGSMAILADQETSVDIRDNEFFDNGQVLPQQGDLIDMPADGNNPAEGTFEVIKSVRNGGGETTLTIRKYETAAP